MYKGREEMKMTDIMELFTEEFWTIKTLQLLNGMDSPLVFIIAHIQRVRFSTCVCVCSWLMYEHLIIIF